MALKTNAERVVEALRASSRPMDDDQLSDRSGVKPRQAVNRICRDLERSGVLRRYPGRDQKIVNELTEDTDPIAATLTSGPLVQVSAGGDEDTPPVGCEDHPSLQRSAGQPAATRVRPEALGPLAAVPGPTDAPDGGNPVPASDSSAGSSHEQRAAEAIMLAALAQDIGLSLSPRRLLHSSGARVELDGADPQLRVLVECWAHQGPAKVAQRYKLMNDAVKLHWIAQDLTPAPERLILCVSDEAAVRHLRGKSWQGQAVADLGVELHIVSLPGEVISSISQAQKRQYR